MNITDFEVLLKEKLSIEGREVDQLDYIKLINLMQQQHKRYLKTIESMRSEINYALYSQKSKDVKRFYLENAIRYADEVLEKEGD